MVVDNKNTFLYLKKSFTGPWTKVIFHQNLPVFEPSPPYFPYFQVDRSNYLLISVHLFLHNEGASGIGNLSDPFFPYIFWSISAPEAITDGQLHELQ